MYMNHIKSLNELFNASSNNEFMEQIDDILRDVMDNGLDVSKDSYSRTGDDYTDISRISVEINDPKVREYDYDKLKRRDINSVFDYSKIESSVSHLLSFMKESGYVIFRIVSSKFDSDDYRFDHTSTFHRRSDKANTKVIEDVVKDLENMEIGHFIKFYFAK
jgi:hypothetical protein